MATRYYRPHMQYRLHASTVAPPQFEPNLKENKNVIEQQVKWLKEFKAKGFALNGESDPAWQDNEQIKKKVLIDTDRAKILSNQTMMELTTHVIHMSDE